MSYEWLDDISKLIYTKILFEQKIILRRTSMYDFSEFRRRQFSLRRVSQPWKEEDFVNVNMKVFLIRSLFSEFCSN